MLKALTAPTGWWKDAEKSVEGIISVCGTDEMLVDPIEEWVKVYKVSSPFHRTCINANNSRRMVIPI